MTVVETPLGTHMTEMRLGGRFRLDEPISVGERISGTCGSSWEADGLALWKATDELLDRPVTIYLLPAGQPVPARVVEAVQAAAKISDPRLATIYDTDLSPECPYIVAEWASGTHLEDLVLSGLPSPALAAAMMADAADAIAVAHQAGLPHLRLTPRSLRWDTSTGLKITGLGIDAALCAGTGEGPVLADAMLADARALARMLYALLTGFWPGQDETALPPAPDHKGRVCTPRQVRAGVPAILDAITHQGLQGQAPDAPGRPLRPAALALALRGVQRPSIRLLDPPEPTAGYERVRRPAHAARRTARQAGQARHARAREGLLHHTTLLQTAVLPPAVRPHVFRV